MESDTLLKLARESLASAGLSDLAGRLTLDPVVLADTLGRTVNAFARPTAEVDAAIDVLCALRLVSRGHVAVLRTSEPDPPPTGG